MVGSITMNKMIPWLPVGCSGQGRRARRPEEIKGRKAAVGIEAAFEKWTTMCLVRSQRCRRFNKEKSGKKNGISMPNTVHRA